MHLAPYRHVRQAALEALAHGSHMDRELSSSAPGTDVGKPKEVERRRFPLPSPERVLGGKAPELDQASFVRVQ